MNVGHYKPWTDSWVFTCAGCGQQFEVADCISPLDELDCCSAECDQKVEAEFDPELRTMLEQEGLI